MDHDVTSPVVDEDDQRNSPHLEHEQDRRKNNFKSDRQRDERRSDNRNKETYHPYVAPKRDQGRSERYRQDYRPFEPMGSGHQRPGVGALTKPLREILATERHLNLPIPRPTRIRPTRENSDKFCEYHKEHGHITNHCKQLKKQLEIALESGKLDHLLKDWKQRGMAGDKGTKDVPKNLMTFCVVRSPSPYNVILGRTGLKEIRAIPSTIHSMIKFPTPKGIATLTSRPAIVSECRKLEEKQTAGGPNTEVPQEAEITGEDDVVGTEEVLINPAYPEQLVVIGKGLSKGF
ncbi:reverse transcriptase domain-containing protein [Artemisia annua]|uniref:Reverse transcriptase domain-containing protein n=1 Tax=Artemisia annua TaxID=35608 RepID=A0A2U1NSG0_ARTAN|nr:reverse transcriptase domain-containing protein [Artemisia annua]